MAFIETHSLREIPEERMASAFTASADPGTKACVIKMIAGGDLEGVPRPGASHADLRCMGPPRENQGPKCQEFETEGGVATRETTEASQVKRDQHVTRCETLHRARHEGPGLQDARPELTAR